MHAFEFALAMVALVLGFKLIRAVMLHKSTTRRDNTVNVELIARLSEVEERVRVLERIVTDERYDLKQQFKDLGA
jgi:hypothetical protein